jgi:ubiquinone/menaquinone biosynthesis C-methylase UbiE
METVLNALRAAAEETRLRIIVLAAHDTLTVSDLVAILGQSQPRVSRHLRLLVEAGLLERYREGPWTFVRLARTGPGAELATHIVAGVDPAQPPLSLDRQRLAELRRRRQSRATAWFRQNAARWDALRALHVDDQDIERLLLAQLPPGTHDLLDIGTGTGRILEVLAPKVAHAVGVDASREMLALARANLAKAQLVNAEIRQADMYALPFEAESFDVITIHQVLHYAEDPAAALREAARVLRPGGTVLAVDFAPHDLVELRREHAHVHLGFADNQMLGWLAAADLEPDQPIHLPGKRLMVGIWRARRGPSPREVAPTRNIQPEIAA